MGIDHLTLWVGEDGAEPPVGEHCCRQEYRFLALDRAPAGW